MDCILMLHVMPEAGGGVCRVVRWCREAGRCMLIQGTCVVKHVDAGQSLDTFCSIQCPLANHADACICALIAHLYA